MIKHPANKVHFKPIQRPFYLFNTYSTFSVRHGHVYDNLRLDCQELVLCVNRRFLLSKVYEYTSSSD